MHFSAVCMCLYHLWLAHSVVFPSSAIRIMIALISSSARFVSTLNRMGAHQSDTIVIPIRILPEPDKPSIHLPPGKLLTTTEDLDIVLENLRIMERDGIYEDGEAEGDSAEVGDDGIEPQVDAGAASAVTRSWEGKVRFRRF